MTRGESPGWGRGLWLLGVMGAVGVIGIGAATFRWATTRVVTSATFLAAGTVYAQIDHVPMGTDLWSTLCRRRPGSETTGWCRTLPDHAMTSDVVGDGAITIAVIDVPHGQELWVLDASDGGTVTTWTLPTRHGAIAFARQDTLLVVTDGLSLRAVDLSAGDTIWTLPGVGGGSVAFDGNRIRIGSRLVDARTGIPVEP